MSDALRHLHEAHGRKQAEEHDRPRAHRRHDQDAKGQDLSPTDPGDQPRHDQTAEEHNQRIGPEAELAPILRQGFPVRRRHPNAPGGAEDQGGRHHRDHAGDVQILLRGDEGEIGKRDGERHLRATLRPQGFQDPHAEPGHHEAEAEPARELLDEDDHGAHDRGVLTPAEQSDQEPEQCDRRRVVEKALAFHQGGQALGRSQIAEDADHRRRVGRGDDGADEEAGDRRHARRGGQRPADDDGGHQHGDDRQKEDRPEIVEEAPQVGGERRFEEKRGKEQREQRLRAQRHGPQRFEEIRERP